MKNIFFILSLVILFVSCNDTNKPYVNHNFLGLNFKTEFNIDSIKGDNDIRFKIDSVNARLITSSKYSINGVPDHLIIYCHGNRQNDKSTPSQEALKWFSQNGISYATIKIQDEVTPPFTTQATGWGNDIAYTRIVKLYEYLMANFNFHKSVIIAGGSMGGLTMGQIAYKRPFPIAFCLGIGVVPSLQEIWNNSEKRRNIIRNSYNLSIDGADDYKTDSIFAEYDWYNMGLCEKEGYLNRTGFPNMYLYYGIDSTFLNEFGGLEMYNSINNQLINAGNSSIVKTNNSNKHADPSLYQIAINDSIFYKERILTK